MSSRPRAAASANWRPNCSESGSNSAQSTDSAAARIALSAARKVRRLIPPNSRRQQTLHAATSRTLVLVEHGPAAVVGAIRRDRELRRAIGVADTAAARRRQYRALARAAHADSRASSRACAARPRRSPIRSVISVVMPVHDPEQAWLDAAIRSVLGQAYPHLRAVHCRRRVDEALRSRSARACDARRARAGRVPRCAGRHRGRFEHCGRRWRPASSSASSTTTMCCAPTRSSRWPRISAHHPDADVVYSDEDKLLPDGGLGAPAFKPEFSPDRLLGENYINHFTVDASLARQRGRWVPRGLRRQSGP